MTVAITGTVTVTWITVTVTVTVTGTQWRLEDTQRSVMVTLAVTRFAPGSADCDDDYDGRRVSEANIKISWTWTCILAHRI